MIGKKAYLLVVKKFGIVLMESTHGEELPVKNV